MQNLISRQKIYDGVLEQCIDNEHVIHFQNKEIRLDIKVFTIHELSQLNVLTLEKVLPQIVHKRSKMFGTYQDQDGLPFFYNILNASFDESKYLVICSFGEVQPGRYKIFLEGVWKWPITD